jgi:hypothetical protein
MEKAREIRQIHASGGITQKWLANFKPEGQRSKYEELEACYAMLFKQLMEVTKQTESACIKPTCDREDSIKQKAGAFIQTELLNAPASDSIGSPVRYTDGTISCEYEEQPQDVVERVAKAVYEVDQIKHKNARNDIGGDWDCVPWDYVKKYYPSKREMCYSYAKAALRECRTYQPLDEALTTITAMGDASTRKDEVHKARASVRTSSPASEPSPLPIVEKK